jgi:hypothetical protein
MTDHDYVVFRAYPDAPPGWMPPDLEGQWVDRARVEITLSDDDRVTGAMAIAEPTGEFEFRDDSVCAEIWEVRPA